MGSVWYAGAAILLVAIVYEMNPRWGGVLLMVVVFGMLLQAQRNGTLSGRAPSL